VPARFLIAGADLGSQFVPDGFTFCPDLGPQPGLDGRDFCAQGRVRTRRLLTNGRKFLEHLAAELHNLQLHRGHPVGQAFEQLHLFLEFFHPYGHRLVRHRALPQERLPAPCLNA
jgi:hypothetical protein